jgi:hypothetical protein
LSSAAKDPEIPLSKESQIVDAACASVVKNFGDPARLTPEQAELLFNPEQHDPLSFLVSDGYLALADQSKSNLVAIPSDNLFNINFEKSENKSFKLRVFLDSVEGQGMSISTDDQWTVASPIDPLDAELARSKRDLLGNCLREAQTHGYISIPTAAELALSEDAERTADLPYTYSLFGQKYSPYGSGGKAILRFYALLSPSQQADLASGNILSGRDLSKDQWDAMLANFKGSLYVEGIDSDEYGDSGDYVLMKEPTELLPDGVPIGASVSLKDHQSDLFFAGVSFGSGGNTYSEESTIDYIASMIASKQVGSEDNFGAGVQWISSGQSHDLDFTFAITDKIRTVASLREIIQGDERWPLDSLPDGVKRLLEPAIAAARAKLDQASVNKPQPVVKPPHQQHR